MHRIASTLAFAMLAASCSVTDAVPVTTTADTAPLVELRLEPAGLGEVALGADPEDVIAAITPAIGAPDGDTGWMDGTDGVYGRCPAELRVVSWGSLALFFAPPPADLFAYSYGFEFDEAVAGVDPRRLDLSTASGISLGTTVADLRERAPGVAVDGDPVIDVWTFAIEPDAEPHLRGQVTGPNSSDTVLFIETSTGCT